MRPVLLVIMDGVGYREDSEGNAVLNANTPNLDNLWNTCPHRLIRAHGHYVGLPSDDDMGNSEVGHNALGCGQIYSQGAKLVNEAISNNTMYESETWKKLVEFCKDNGTMHFIGLLSDGNVHSHINHLLSLLEHSKLEGIKKVRVHILLDGRDVPPTSALDYVKILESKMDSLNDDTFDSRIASGGGRMYITMDRYEADWPMVERGWHTHVLGDARHFKSATEAITTMRNENPGMDDQNLLNFVIVDENDTPLGTINDNDSVIFYNFRGDRALEISESFDDEVFDKYDRIRYPKAMYAGMLQYDADKHIPKMFRYPKAMYAGMLQYDADKHIPKMFLTEPPKITNTLTEELNKYNIHEYAISETQKYGHVTYFWNGNKLGKFNEELEDYVEIPSSKLPFPEQPFMKAKEITDALVPAILSNKYQFLRVNYANGDMIGHTGIYEKAVIAIETVDRELGRLKEAIDQVNGIMIILADHGNSEIMYQLKDIEKHIPHTSHTTSPVPFIIYGENVTIKEGDFGLSNVASTICDLLGVNPNPAWNESIINK